MEQIIFNDTVPTYVEIIEGKWEGLKGYIQSTQARRGRYELRVFKGSKMCKLVVDQQLCKVIGGTPLDEPRKTTE